ncbi:MAG: T9SS type A sorting domain-containing protein [Cloacibacterium sp.]|nr:T9SS type A sorting domain-containing protein [Cloacibacterium sp.]
MKKQITLLLMMTIAVINAQLTVQGRYLKDLNGNNLLLRGVNVPIYGNGWSSDLIPVADAIKNNTKSNAVRILWYSPAIQNTIGNPPYYASLANLDAAITAYANRGMISIVFLRDLTVLHDNTVAGFNNYVIPFWTNPAVVNMINNHKNHVIINLMNEWGATWDANSLGGANGQNVYINTYSNAVNQIRAAGVTVPIMIDAPDGGANSNFVIATGQNIINNDPLNRILFSVHSYWSQENGHIVNCPQDYITKLDAMKNSNLPFVLGEATGWAPKGSNGQEIESTPPVNFVCPSTASPNNYAINYDALLTRAVTNDIGFLAWNWYQDGLKVRCIYDQATGLSQNTSPNAGSWPTDILSSTKVYGLNYATLSSSEVNKDKIEVVPNPSTGNFRIIGNPKISTVHVFDSSGRKTNVSTIAKNHYKIENPTNGIYFIYIETESGKKINEKIIVHQ